ncbi:phage/plasmid primase, P4 family [Roseofilum sp. BLCC_M154]|uniref:Phage/plasmid primase, P4 family n=1 Tax=Roseofilum acuticapitatum BLCC-M154 TaxID=3022444 RepID=A0ABT7AS04_9CYAN|nr:phage/plasmid primase, P4 family [Roseofilum acuticapitatum]MDJ1169678.1 phage/plasmid primase, P4 family [Roseofilum acuticapitatum BLCC-M154]
MHSTPNLIKDCPTLHGQNSNLSTWIADDLNQSGIKDKYLRSLITPIAPEAIAAKLNWKQWNGSPGWESTGANIDGSTNPNAWQVKAQTPPLDSDGKPRKYLNRKGCPTDAYLPQGNLENFPQFARRYKEISFPLVESGEDTKAIGEILKDYPFPIIITEGIKKCLAGWQAGWATVSVPGVTSWHKRKKPQELKPILEALFPHGGNRQVALAFDADFTTNPKVWGGLIGLAKELQRRGYDCRICTWNINQGKGMDDFIANGGNFDEVVETAMMIAQWEKQFISDHYRTVEQGKRKDKPPTPVSYAREVAEANRDKWKFHNEQKTWREWNGQYWQAIPPEKIGDEIYHQVKDQIQTDKWVTDCQKTLERELRQWEWMPQSESVRAFANGVVDMETLEMSPHDPENMNTSVIDRDWWKPSEPPPDDPLDALEKYCPNIYGAWAYAMGGDRLKMLKLLAICHGVMGWRFSALQKFIHLYGAPGTGKGTFARILEALVGDDNAKSSKLAKLGSDYDVAHWIDAQLVTLPDEGGKISEAALNNLKSITGGDRISYRQIYGKTASSKFNGTMLMISNDPLFRGETGAIKRRLCLVEFNRPIPLRNHMVEQLMLREIPQLTYCALRIAPQKCDEIIRGLGAYEIPEFNLLQWKMETQENSVAEFLDHKIVAAPGIQVETKSLYALYQTFCEETGQKPAAQNKFTARLITAANHVGWDASYGRNKRGSYTIGLILRDEEAHREVPTPTEILETAIDYHNGLKADLEQDRAVTDGGDLTITGRKNESSPPPEPPAKKPDRAHAPAPAPVEKTPQQPTAIATGDGNPRTGGDSKLTGNEKPVTPSGKGFGQPMTANDSKKSPAAPTQNTPQLTPPEQLNHGDRVEYIPYYGNPNAPREMIYVEPWKDGRHYVCSPDHFHKGMKGSRQYCSVPRLAIDRSWKEDIFWKV